MRKKSVFASLKSAVVLAGIGLLVLPAAGCARQDTQMRVTGEQDRGAEVTLAADEQPAAQADSVKRIIVTKHGPRRR